MKKLSDTFVTESNDSARIALQKMNNSDLLNCFIEFINTRALMDFLSECLWNEKASIKNFARHWIVNTMIDEKVTIDDLKKSGWC